MDLYSRRIVGWHIDKRMTTDLITKALVRAKRARQPQDGLVFHSDRGSQYTANDLEMCLKSTSWWRVWGAVFAGSSAL